MVPDHEDHCNCHLLQFSSYNSDNNEGLPRLLVANTNSSLLLPVKTIFHL